MFAKISPTQQGSLGFLKKNGQFQAYREKKGLICQKMSDCNGGLAHYCHNASKISFHPLCKANIYKNYI